MKGLLITHVIYNIWNRKETVLEESYTYIDSNTHKEDRKGL